MGEEKIIKNIVEELKGCPFIKGIVLGGSRATGTAAADPDFERIKAHAEQYPAPLKSALLNSFLFESGFSCMLAKKGLSNNDIYCLTGHVFRSVSALNQVLFALNEQWCLNEKKAVFRIDTFRPAPLQYSMRVSKVFEELAPSPDKALEMLERLCEETKRLCESVSTKGL